MYFLNTFEEQIYMQIIEYNLKVKLNYVMR